MKPWRLAALALSVALAASSPARAFDALERLAAMLPPSLDPMWGNLANYVDVRTLTDYVRTEEFDSVGVNAGLLLKALHERWKAGEAIGIDTTAFRHQMIIGTAFEPVIYAMGEHGFAAHAPTVLQRRSFVRSTLGADTVWALGEDGKPKPEYAHPGDPFVPGEEPRRYLLRDALLVGTRTWPELRTAAAALSGPRAPLPRLAGAMLPILRKAIGPGAVAQQASLWCIEGLSNTVWTEQAIKAIEAGITPPAPTEEPVKQVPYVMAWMVAGQDGKDAFVAVAMLHVSEDDARRGSAEYGRRLQAFGMGDGPRGTVTTTAVATGRAWNGIIVVRFANQPPKRGGAALAAWSSAIADGKFTPLDARK